MSFVLPSYPITFQAKANFNFNLGLNPVAPYVLAATPCNLVYGFRVRITAAPPIATQFLLFASGVALKGQPSYVNHQGDAVEVPQGSGRWYSVLSVDRVAAGFSNEHQCALISIPFPVFATPPLWPAP